MPKDPVGHARRLLPQYSSAEEYCAALADHGIPYRSFGRKRRVPSAEGYCTEVITQVDVAGVAVGSFREYDRP